MYEHFKTFYLLFWCSDLIDDDITDDVKCVLTIYNEHEGLSGNGFNAWLVSFLIYFAIQSVFYVYYLFFRRLLNLIWDYIYSIACLTIRKKRLHFFQTGYIVVEFVELTKSTFFVIKMKLVQTLRLKSSSMSTAKTKARLRTYAKHLSFC